MKEAVYYKKLNDQEVRCELCPNNCILKDGETGSCRIRQNINGVLYATTWHHYTAIGFDPIEKKPLYHFHPGKQILSVGSLGCNMHCKWCQNCEISQQGVLSNIKLKEYTPHDLLEMARQKKNNIGIAYTYNEPSISYETNIETARLFYENGLQNVLVTNGYMSEKVLDQYLMYTDAINLDIKSFNGQVHKKFTGASLKPVLRNAKKIHLHKTHLEITYLIVNGVNDPIQEFEAFIHWVRTELSPDIPLHLSRYFPRHEYLAPATSVDVLCQFAELASKELSYVYLGNMNSDKFRDTYCKKCGALLIERSGFTAQSIGLSSDNACKKCNTKLIV